MNIGNALGTSLFLFFLMCGIGQLHAEAEENLLLIIVVYTIFVVAHRSSRGSFLTASAAGAASRWQLQ